MTRPTRSVLALAAVLALVLLPAAPAAAVPTVGTITSNFFRINLPTPVVIPLPGACAAPTLTFDVTSVTGTAPNRTATGTATLDIPRGAYPAPGTPLMLVLLASGPLTLTESVAGQFSVSAALSLDGVGGRTARIFTRLGPCSVFSLACTTVSTAGLTLVGGYSGTVSSSMPISGNADVAVTGTLATVGCSGPYSAYNGTTVYAPIYATF